MRSAFDHVVAFITVTALPAILVLALFAATAPPSLKAPPTPASVVKAKATEVG